LLSLPGHRVLARQQCALPAQAVQQLMERDVGRLALEPGVELPVEERVGTAVHEGHHRQPPGGSAQLGFRAEEPLGGKGLAHQPLELERSEDFHGRRSGRGLEPPGRHRPGGSVPYGLNTW
jgi:hypothetical protein